MANKSTPAPHTVGGEVWIEDPAYHRHGAQRYLRIIGPDGSTIALVLADEDDADGPANAALYAAAPDMLEILRTTAGNIKSLGAAGCLYHEYREWLAGVEAAVAKAEGRA